MKILKQSPKKSLNKSFLKQRPLRSEIELFKKNLIRLLDHVDEIEREENLKNHIRDFLRDTYYKETNEVNTKDTKDLVIHLGKTNKDKVGVIIEAKRPGNKNEMISITKPNTKSFQELVLYYLRERIEENNIDIKYLIITNVYEWYIFDASWFEKLFYRSKSFIKEYEQWRDGQKVTKDTNLFYSSIAQPFIDKIEEEITCTYYDIRDYEDILRNKEKNDDKSLIALQKLLSPYFLLKQSFANDSNTLNQNFYKELLHIIGLEEVKEGSKNIIRRKEKDRNEGSIIENTINILETENSLSKIKDRSAFGETRDEQIFSVALELSLNWIIRILFLKLLEGLLVTYHKGNKDFRFLNIENIQDFDELYKLFHQVLDRKVAERAPSVKQKYARVPYLNSSLFEISNLENLTIKINSLDDAGKLELLSATVLKEEKKKSNTLPTLEYLFRFLDAYDFGSEGGEDIAEDNKTIINTSVLGKVFEKINGYKDGSIYTPGFITMYMSRQSLRLAVVQKFNEYFKAKNIAEVSNFEEIYNQIDKIGIKAANDIINSIRACDPAVGSGHFLVSMLNELILIKAELGILVDKAGKRLRDYEFVVENDELIISDENGIYAYNYQNKESQRVQETLFNEKQTIIENCLFGVDINPKSVMICRLRLWIELLKNAYYKNLSGFENPKGLDELELETLPNIDINIKCGNSLISRYALDADLKKALQKSKWNVSSYQLAVMTYRNAKSKEEKHEMERLINEIKNNFETEISNSDKRYKKLAELRGELSALTTQTSLFDKTEKEKADWNIKVKELTEAISKQEQLIEEIKNNVIYKNAFEWRFEFPEVLNDNGDFVGFDVVIGNPPYIDIKGLGPIIVESLFVNFSTTENRINLYSLFIELGNLILRNSGVFYFINPNSILMNSSYSKIRNLISDNVSEIIKLPDNVFAESDVKVETIIIAFRKNIKTDSINVIRYGHKDEIDLINSNLFEEQSKEIWNKTDIKFNIYLTNKIQKVLTKSSLNTRPLVELADFTLGITPYDKYKGHSEQQIKQRAFHSPTKISEEYKPIITGENIQRYIVNSTPKEFLRYGNWLGAQREERFFNEPRVIVRQIVSGNPLKIYAGYSDKSLYFTQIGFAIIPKNPKEISPKYLTALLNSSLINFIHKFLYLDIEKELFQKILIENCKQFPIRRISLLEQAPFVDLVDKIIEAKQQNQDTTDFENKIDQLVYKLYGLTEEEIQIVEEAVK
ncbi:MAG: TaqI-like C-terminal specificity domain-containing protein [Bacteroidales bacterium]